MRAEPPDPKIDTTVPHPARVYDYWLGGKDQFRVDREFGDKIRAAFPGIVDTAVENRHFLRRLVTYLARVHGVRQFLDIGAGLPTADNVHQVAQRVDPAARIVYVDNDPLVLVHARALLTSTPEGETAYIDADIREPDKIIGSGELASTLDLSQPVALLMIAILHFISDDADPYAIVGRLAGALPSGSFVAATHGTFDGMSPGTATKLDGLSKSSEYPFHPRTEKQIVSFFDGFDLLEPGVVNIVDWRPEDEPTPKHPREEVAGYGGLARIR